MSLQPACPENRVVITVGEVDHATVGQFADEIGRAASDGSDGVLIVDLRQVTFIGSAGIRVLIDADQAAMARGGRVCVDGAQGVVLRCLEVTGVLERLQLGADGTAPGAQTT